ncbi:hypothetical protein MAHJHV59_50350 [Mycobacterium avium subsp. hominissuis]
MQSVHDQVGAAAGLDIQLKRGLSDNELNRYRYDVVDHPGLRNVGDADNGGPG